MSQSGYTIIPHIKKGSVQLVPYLCNETGSIQWIFIVPPMHKRRRYPQAFLSQFNREEGVYIMKRKIVGRYAIADAVSTYLGLYVLLYKVFYDEKMSILYPEIETKVWSQES